MDKDLQRRVIFGGVALAIFIPVLMIGGALLQIGMGLLAMLGVHELLQMKGLRSTTLEGVLAMLAGFVLTIPLENYLKFLPIDGNVVAYSLVVFLLLGSTVLGKNYSFEDAAYPIAASFYVGIGFNALLDARVAGFDKVLLALFIVWATDSGAYLIGRRYGVRRLAPHVSPNKTIEGSLGGIAPLGDILIYNEPANKVFVQGVVATISNGLTVAIAGTVLLLAYARTQTKSGSLKKD